MKTRKSPRNQEILWRSLGGKKPTPPARSPISRLKPIFDWKQNRYVAPTDATYLDRLGTGSAIRYSFVIKKQAAEHGITLPLPDVDVEFLLDQTIAGLSREKKIAWDHTSTDSKAVFVNAWSSEMTRQGIRS